jgi:peptidyl-prolyl cis-trans isomerase D
MLQVFRDSIGRYIAIAILALIALTFVFFGIDFSVTQLTFAAKVNGEPISVPEFDRQLRREQNRIQSLVLDELSDDMRRQIRRSVIDEMVARELMAQITEEAGYRISDARLLEIMQSDEVFQVGGRFSRDVYLSLLTAEGLTPAGFENMQRDVYTVGELQGGLLESSFITPAEFRRRIELYYERREVAYALFAAADFLDQVTVSDEAIAEYYAENGDLFQTEESVDIEFIDFDLATIAATIDISENELREYYEDEIERYAVSEERRVRHILIEPEGDDYVEAEAEVEAIMARLDAGEDFAAVAAEVSDDVGTREAGGDLGWMGRGVLEGPFEDALFDMSVGEVRGPVETEFGFHVLKLDEVRAGDQLPFEAVRDDLRAELASDQAYSTFIDQANDLANDAFDARDDLQSVADDYGFELQSIEGLTRTSSPSQFPNPAPIIAAAFDDRAIATGENSDLIELNEEHVAVIRVAAHHLPEARTLEEVTDEIRSILDNENAADLAAEAATRYFDALNAEPSGDVPATEVSDDAPATEASDDALTAEASGDILARAEMLAEENGATWNAPTWIVRSSNTTPAVITTVVFNQPRPTDGTPAILRAPVGDGDQAIVVFSRVEPGVPEDISVEEREQGQEDLRAQAAEEEFNIYATDAIQRARIRIPDEILDPQL